MSLRKINNVLLVVVILVNLYVLAVPILPQILYHIEKNSGKQQDLETIIHQPAPTTTTTTTTTTQTASSPSLQGNRVIIPVMMLDQPIVEDSQANVYKALDKGVWRWPGGSTPDRGGNTVLVGHRFTYTKPKGVFYFLDKVHAGDNIGMIWNGHTYLYQVTSTEVVPPTQTSILNATEDSELTIYTCTPLWSPKNRLVVHATLEAIQ